jgi:hypothetical protein
MRTGTLRKQAFDNLRQLPRDKNYLDFIRGKLIGPDDKERREIVNELFEMHRTSEGFDPLSLCKARVSRVKSTVIKKMLVEIDAEVGAILQSMEFRNFVTRSDSSARLHELFLQVRGKILKNDFSDVEKSIADLKELVGLSSKQDLLIALYKVFNSKTRERSPEPEIFLRNIKM